MWFPVILLGNSVGYFYDRKVLTEKKTMKNGTTARSYNDIPMTSTTTATTITYMYGHRRHFTIYYRALFFLTCCATHIKPLRWRVGRGCSSNAQG